MVVGQRGLTTGYVDLGFDMEGYSTFDPYTPLGTLGGIGFTYGDSTHFLWYLYWRTFEDNTNRLSARFSPTPPAAVLRWRIIIDDRLLRRTEANSYGRFFYRWPNIDLNWADGDEVDVKLIETATASFDAATYTNTEGETFDVTVTLDEAFVETTVTVPVTVTANGGAVEADYSGIPEELTFAPGDTSKTFTVTVVDDTEDDDDESLTLSFGEENHIRPGGANESATITLTDNDHPEVEVEFGASAYTVAEGASQSITVTLNADLERTLIIPIEATGQDGATAADHSGVPSSVTFNDGEMEKSFTFTATQDNIDDDNESVQLGFGTMPDPRISAGTRDEVTLSITDDDTAVLVVSRASLTVGEGESSSYTVKLTTEPTASVTVTISGHAGTDLTLSAATLTNNALTFTAANWNTAQTVTVAAGHDDDGIPDAATLTHTASGGGYAGLTDELSVTVTDDDMPAVVLTPGAIAMEESQKATYAVKLATEPTVTVTVTISGHAGTDLTLSGTTLTNNALTFTSTNWDTAQTVSVAGAHDTDSISDVETLTHTASGGEYAGVESTLRVAVNDDDTGALRLVDGNLTDENGRLCEGRLEIFYNGAWGTICDDYWTKDDADVACRALGFVASVEDYNRYRTAYFGPGTAEQEIVLDDLNCNGDESGLLECPSGQPGPGIHNCRHSEDVSLRCLKVGESPPWIIDVEFGDPPGGNGAYDAGETLEATLVWSEPVTVSTPSGGLLPKVWVLYGNGASGHTDIAEYASGSGTDRTVFRYTLQSGSHSLVGVSHNSLAVRDGSIVSVESGLDAELGHSSYYSAQSENQSEAVTIIGVPTFNDPGPDNAWSAGEAVEVTFTFSRPVQVDTTGGAPSLPVVLSGTMSRQAPYLRGSGTRQLVFGYTLTGADGTHSSLLVAPNSLALNGGSIQDVDNMLDGAIEHQGAGAFYVQQICNCSAIMSSLTVKRKCPHEGTCDIDAERADKASGSQQFDGGPYDHGAGSDFDGSERAPHQAYSGGLQKGRRSRTRSRQSRSQTGQRYIGPVGDRRGGPGADPIRGSQPHAPERVAEGARGHRHRS